MARSSTGTDRLAKGIAGLLALAAVAAICTAWLLNCTTDQKQADVSANLPPALSSTAAPTPSHRTTTHARHRTQGAGKSSASTTASSPPKRHAVKPKPLVHPLRPQHLFVPQIKVNTTIAAKPTEMQEDPFLNKVVPSFGVPDDMYTTTWWSSGPKPGGRGMAVVLGHTQIGGYGVFNNLGKLRAGNVIGVSAGAATLKFVVMSVQTGISKTDPNALSRVLESHPADARLALLTCSGDFNEGYRESAENTVVFARLVGYSS